VKKPVATAQVMTAGFGQRLPMFQNVSVAPPTARKHEKNFTKKIPKPNYLKGLKMRVKTLKNILQTNYIVANQANKYLSIGTELCHNIISIDKETGTVEIIDIFRDDKHAHLNELCEKIKEIDKDILWSILNENDPIENPIEIYRYKGTSADVEKTSCEIFGYPETDIDGFLQYEDTHFRTEKQALEKGIKYSKMVIENNNNYIFELIDKLSDVRIKDKSWKISLRRMTKQLQNITGENTTDTLPRVHNNKD
jgi:hypothetical protein